MFSVSLDDIFWNEINEKFFKKIGKKLYDSTLPEPDKPKLFLLGVVLLA